MKEVTVNEDDFVSHDPSDTGFNKLTNWGINCVLWGPEDIIKKKPRGIIVNKKIEGHEEYPPDVVLYELWRENRKEYDRLKKQLFTQPKCVGMDFFTEVLYTQLKSHDNKEFHEGKAYVSYSDALESPNSVRRTLNKEQFGNTRFNLPRYDEEPDNTLLNIRVST